MRIFDRFLTAVRRQKTLAAALYRDRRGIAAVEFAMLAPILITAFIGTFEISEAVTINPNTTESASTVADLVTQTTVIDDTEINDIFDATASVMSPYDDSGLEIVVAAVGANPDTKAAEVVWSKANGGSAWATGAPPPVTVPSSLDLTVQQIVIAQATFSYEAVFPELAKELFGSTSFTMQETFYLRPRNSESIEFKE